ncbi:MAG: hypothetical protein BWY31_01147 [Lentisphaerae bacterium ADurb.Bin242]|nr:MAG: hypothetical protein BWY31_01147 [Lentisphaerae bacterium ADurb.Bin242]
MEFSKLLADAYYNFYTSKGKVSPLWYNSYCPNPEYMYFGPVDAIEAIENERTADLPKRHDVYSTMSEVNGRFYFDLASRLEKMVPGKKIAFMAYQNYLAAPEHIKKFPDNVRIMACTGTPLFIRDKASENFWRKICTDWNRKLQDKVVLYPYDAAFHLEGGFAHALRGYFENEFLQKVAHFSNDTVIYPCCYFRWDYYYSLYLMSRAYWDPDFDRDAVLDEQWKLLYGPAAPALKEFYEYVIDRWIKYYIPCATIRHRSIAGVDYDTLHKKTYPPEVLQKMRKMLEKACSLVDKNSIEGKRLTFFIMPWERIMDGAMAYGMAKPPLPCRAEFTETNLKIDGRLDEPCWKKASAIPFRSAYYGEIKKNLPLPQAKIIWSQEGLYVGIFNPGPFKKKGNLWDEDNFEFFISPGLTKNKLFQFVCSSSGLHEDYFKSFEPPRELDPAWKCRDFRKAIVSDVQGWSCEIFIPYAALECTAPVAGDSWLFNWVNNRTDSETTSAAPTMGNNRNINFYGKLYFAGNCE